MIIIVISISSIRSRSSIIVVSIIITSKSDRTYRHPDQQKPRMLDIQMFHDAIPPNELSWKSVGKMCQRARA